MGSPARSQLRGAAAENATAPAPQQRDGSQRRRQTTAYGDDAVGSPTSSPVRSPLRGAAGAENQLDRSPLGSRAPDSREEAAGSPLRFAEKPASPARRDEAAGSPLRSPLRRAEKLIRSPPPPRGFSGKAMSPARREEAIGSPLRLTEKPMSPARRDEALGSPLRLSEKPIPSPPRNTPEKPGSPAAQAAAPPPIAGRLVREDRAKIAKVVAGNLDGGGGARDGEGGVLGVVPEAVRRAEVRRAALGLRVSAAVLCLISFSLMASDKTPGWDGDFFDRYEEYRYSLAVNVISFAYSGFQVFVEAHRMITLRYIIRHQLSCYFNLAMDQILAYLLISSSSAAASRNDVWVTRFGGDDFTRMVNASVAVSFLAFMAVALSAVISAYNLFGWNW